MFPPLVLFKSREKKLEQKTNQLLGMIKIQMLNLRTS